MLVCAEEVGGDWAMAMVEVKVVDVDVDVDVVEGEGRGGGRYDRKGKMIKRPARVGGGCWGFYTYLSIPMDGRDSR